MSENNFISGLFAKAPHERAPDFVKASISIKVKDLGNFLREKNQQGEEWVNVQIKESKGGKWYAELDTWKPDPNRQHNSGPQNQDQYYSNQGGSGQSDDFDSDSIPF